MENCTHQPPREERLMAMFKGEHPFMVFVEAFLLIFWVLLLVLGIALIVNHMPYILLWLLMIYKSFLMQITYN